ncbi:P-loop containing nucleoside triphosphate hydrolase protein [Piedraia hortae CBS 480.64]|uniref:Signal recognition particle receptor subunit alpha homolog n=1 Tax=Piedraia hortae CBS 480.64 TaxID=1314780 RepID=A0A6A7BS47_9PEZI|nr:P-loop containing nucleoside triphosphate hydrolase protein [Piedraia hortae CBS 480.64]
MLDGFEVLTTSGIVLWRKHYTPLSPHLINSFVVDALIEDKQGAKEDSDNEVSSYKKEKHLLKWTWARDLGLVFVSVYQSILNLAWVDRLLTAARALFVKEYGAQLKKPNVIKLDTSRFDALFDALIKKLDTGSTVIASATVEDPPPALPFVKPVVSSRPTSGLTTPDTANSEASRPTTPAEVLKAKTGPGKASRRARKAQHQKLTSSAPVSSDEGSRRPQKAKRQWDADGMAVEDDSGVVLDYSTPQGDSVAARTDIDASHMGQRSGQHFVLKDLDDEIDAAVSSQSKKPEKEATGLLNRASSRIAGLFRNVVGGKKLTKADLQQPLAQMQTHLLEKNVAREAAERLCRSVEADLLNHTTASFTSVEATIHESMARALTKILTPTSSLDLLREITATISTRPYVISIVGVNGVGKSTNLSKIAYFLLQNRLRVLVVAADTFRSGAVEQLRVHVRNLTELSQREGVGRIELFERGYGKDAANVAKEAVAFASGKFDVVLIDTAGRRHNDARLMSSLTTFGRLAKPDKIFMVGEALVGSDSVAQARSFAREFVDEKGRMRNNGAGMDGFIVSKCDTVGDMVGTLVSMVHATGIPVVFLGIGQLYGDLRGLNVQWAVDKLMK